LIIEQKSQSDCRPEHQWQWILYELPAHQDAKRYGAIWGELKWGAGQELLIDSFRVQIAILHIYEYV
jgi:hypothetical protein